MEKRNGTPYETSDFFLSMLNALLSVDNKLLATLSAKDIKNESDLLATLSADDIKNGNKFQFYEACSTCRKKQSPFACTHLKNENRIGNKRDTSITR